ncbi:twin-arginine translocase subunit TatC [Halobacterium jilantaiense]|uniref:Sec-independent protein translocase protein TatC n=1 Tax=Halobacterium jilantaiense TaxID=355548 RepID=A0A1I0PUM6_9EURY|nr:twin-arginine translocase subunit TatC [Halobacterium jilantaiense]SEW18086.1 sec-independent protein translocase protein TatC [Halobacterium jilantaiense]
MAEESDGGRDLAGERPSRPDWESLQSAVRRVDESSDDAPAASAEESAGPTPAAQRVDDTPNRVDWDDLDTAVERADDGDSGDGWEWGTDDGVPPDLAEGESPATDPELLADDDHQSDGPAAHEGDRPAAPGEDDSVITADSAPEPAGTGGMGMSAPETDEEAPLAEHVEEMIKRLAIVITIAGLASVIVFPLTESLISTIWNGVLPSGEAVDPRIYQPLELLITQLKVASLAGLIVALPAFVYESYAFMRPGLYPNERRYYLASVPTSLVLAVLGVVFAFFVVLPYTMDYFVGYTNPTADVAFALGTTFNLILMVMGYLAVVFQIPLFIMLAIMLGVVTRRWLEDRRLLFWAAFAGISAATGAIDPTGVLPVIVAVTMIVLFEGTLALLRWTGN